MDFSIILGADLNKKSIMKNLLLFSCKDDNDGKLPDHAYIYINGQDKTNKTASSSEAMTVSEICRYDSILLMKYHYFEGQICGGFGICTIVTNPNNEGNNGIDTVNNRISILAREVSIGLEYITGGLLDTCARYVILDGHHTDGGGHVEDTLAYIPKAQHRAAVEKLEELYKDKDNNWSEIYRIFNEAFIFVPCTGDEYKAMPEEALTTIR